MQTYQKPVVAVLTSILLLTACGGRHTATSGQSHKDTLEVMTRPFESSTETKIYRLPHNLKQVTPVQEVTAVLIHQMNGYGQDTTFAKQAAALLGKVINSADFKNTVINNTYHEDNGLSPQQIYDLVMQAHEPVGPGGSDHVVDLYLRVITEEEDGAEWIHNCDPGSRMGTIGIDGAGTGIAAVCPQWLRSTAQQKKPSWLAAHFIHEYMHVLGFKHRFIKSKSVPYKIQYIVEQLGEQYDPQ